MNCRNKCSYQSCPEQRLLNWVPANSGLTNHLEPGCQHRALHVTVPRRNVSRRPKHLISTKLLWIRAYHFISYFVAARNIKVVYPYITVQMLLLAVARWNFGVIFQTWGFWTKPRHPHNAFSFCGVYSCFLPISSAGNGPWVPLGQAPQGEHQQFCCPLLGQASP